MLEYRVTKTTEINVLPNLSVVFKEGDTIEYNGEYSGGIKGRSLTFPIMPSVIKQAVEGKIFEPFLK